MAKLIFRLLFSFIVFVGIFMIIQDFLTPESFGKYGHYRANAIDDNKLVPSQYKGEEKCASCHEDIYDLKSETMEFDDDEYILHSKLRCETCHTPKISADTECKIMPPKLESTRKMCGQCHSYQISRKNKIKMIDLADHHKEMNCIECHNPHKPWIE
ncbi:MAG TPA: multiheme c-type cytochrome [Flavobacteriaceae bacterium]|nr:multiheme c-type cytochrome [Flavobacteriaceae bacterium]